MRQGVRVFTVLALLAITASARASDSEHAAQLFSQGRILLEGGAFQEACQLFRESFELEPRVGTQMNVANCAEKSGNLLAALRYWTDATELARTNADTRAAYAAARAAAVAERIPRLTVHLAPGAPEDAIVSLDGVTIPSTGLRSAQVAPGDHLLVATARNWNETRLHVSVAEREQSEITIELAAPVVVAPPESGAGPSAVVVPAPTEGKPLRHSRHEWMQPTAYALAALGLATAAAGTYFGIDAITKKNAADAQGGCSASLCTTATGLHLRNLSAAAAAFSTASFIATGLAATGAVALFVLASRAQAGVRSIRVAAGPLGASVSGSF
jgi:tetratricopeptide (TPR) repeat protein